MVADVEYGLILWYVLFSDDGEFYAGEECDDLKRALYDAQGTDVTRPRVEFSNDPLDQKDWNREDQEQNDEGGNDQKRPKSLVVLSSQRLRSSVRSSFT